MVNGLANCATTAALTRRHLRRGRQKFARVFVPRLHRNLFGAADFNDLPAIHHGYASRKVTDHRHGVRDKQISEPKIPLQLLQKIHDLRAHAHIERRNRFIGDNKLRPQSQSARNANALPLTSGKLVRITRA